MKPPIAPEKKDPDQESSSQHDVEGFAADIL